MTERRWKVHAVRKEHRSSAPRCGTSVWWDTLCGRTLHSPFYVEGGVIGLGPVTCRSCKRNRSKRTVMKGAKSKVEIEAMIARLEADDRYSYPPASTFANAPLALIQVELKGQVAALRWAAGLDDVMATSAASARPRKKRPVS